MSIRLNVDRLRAAAKERGHTTDMQIAAETGVSGSTISRLARPGSTQKPLVDTFHALGRPYGLSVDELILDEDEDEKSHTVAA
ncbi:helix-turn-helix domain-containing protein [Streptacidiphilus cavernicola]|uniref:Helix-turn-helix domain-containing protein n=1 Tax=Streptacidiphilus cavernicola TaxID=3342716 RepID=A0ABV6W491_9ACTN